MNSRIFSTDRYQGIARRTKEFLNGHEDFLSPSTARSPRAFGDALEGILGDNFRVILGEDCAEYSANFARRAMADIAFKDNDGLYYVVDVKTHREDTKFNMPNLTSVERLTRFYEDDSNYFVLLLVRYRLEGTHAVISEVTFVPIEFLDWECLTIGALGWGQIQIANANHISLKPHYSRKSWMLELCDIMLDFYPREIGKIETRIEYFQRVRQHWEAKTE
ncbi:MAG TPA: hypothetical protein PLL20_13205 [Phycisphaerae bacterium]|nr:hypothetical protein [Phycisphaerae bacterium]HRR85084.1 hypothetical protein [Phycisphaerae bacterium]